MLKPPGLLDRKYRCNMNLIQSRKFRFDYSVLLIRSSWVIIKISSEIFVVDEQFLFE